MHACKTVCAAAPLLFRPCMRGGWLSVFCIGSFVRHYIVEDFVGNIMKPRLIVNLYPRYAQVNGEEGRVIGEFSIQVDFGARMLSVKETPLDVLSALLRKKSGEQVYENHPHTTGGVCPPPPWPILCNSGPRAMVLPTSVHCF